MMSNHSTPFVCGICNQKYHNGISLIKHVELRHKSTRQLSTPQNTNSGTFQAKTVKDKHEKSLDSETNNDG